MNSHILRPRHFASGLMRRIQISETKGMPNKNNFFSSISSFNEGLRSKIFVNNVGSRRVASDRWRNTLPATRTIDGIEAKTLVNNLQLYGHIMRPLSTTSSPLLLGSSFGIRHHLHALPISPNIGSIAVFSTQNNNSNFSPKPPPKEKRSLGNVAGMMGTGALVLFGKTKYVLAALKLTKLAPLGSMLLTVGTYSMFFGLPYAAGMVGLILVHEIGHAAVMNARGMPFSPMVFIPFMGAFIATKELPRNAWEDALIAFGGPVLGGLGAGVVGLAGHATDSQLLIALADFGLMINLFNLLPLGSMDGGRIAGAVSPYMNLAGVGMGAGLAYTGAIQNPLFYLILLSGGYQTFQRFYNPGAIHPSYYAITPMQRATVGLGYIGLISVLALAMDLNGRYKKSPEVLVRERELEKTWDMR